MDPEELTLPSGETVTVRGLTGLEVALIGKRNAATADDPDSAAGIALQLGFSVLGKTRVRDAEQAGTSWMVSHSGGDFTAVSSAIERLSGFGKGAAKSDVPGDGGV